MVKNWIELTSEMDMRDIGYHCVGWILEFMGSGEERGESSVILYQDFEIRENLKN